MRYYVGDEFDLLHRDGDSLQETEMEVERENLRWVGKRCQIERAQKQRMHEAVRHYAGMVREDAVAKAGSFATPSCVEKDRLERMRNRS